MFKYNTYFTILLLLICHLGLQAQSGTILGKVTNKAGEPVGFSNVALIQEPSKKLIKVYSTKEDGGFVFTNLSKSKYSIEITYVGYPTLNIAQIVLEEGETKDLGVLTFGEEQIALEAATITARRSIVEVKSDRTVFNVEGTINSAGENMLGLLRKAPGVLVDNNNNITIQGRSGMLLYVDGKKVPLTGEDLSNYIQSINAANVDRVEIISNPGAQYEAQGNGGIIDIKLKKAKTKGYNGSVNISDSQGFYNQFSTSANVNVKLKKWNVYANAGFNSNTKYMQLEFGNNQNNYYIGETARAISKGAGYQYKLGTDYSITERSTVGFDLSGNINNDNSFTVNNSFLAATQTAPVDSFLRASSDVVSDALNQSYGAFYQYKKNKQFINVDLNYGSFGKGQSTEQGNYYVDPTKTIGLSNSNVAYQAPSEIKILTSKFDFENVYGQTTLGLGAKYSKVNSDNRFKFYDKEGSQSILNLKKSNNFDYAEQVYALYANAKRAINKKIKAHAGIRAELSDINGVLSTPNGGFLDTVKQNYIQYFPNVGISYQFHPMHSLSLNFGKRINRPNYNVLNPFRMQLSELSYRKGNPYLKPEILYNIEASYTAFYRFNFKLSYSKTLDQLTRLISPDTENPKAGYLTWDNLAEQGILSFNVALPMQLTPWWSMFVNGSLSHIRNEAKYSETAIVDISATTYNVFQQSTFKLPWKLTGEISGWYSGPGVWGGVFLYKPNGSLNFGLQRKFLSDALQVKLTANDVFKTMGWDGASSFNGLESTGRGMWDSRRYAVSLSYRFGNKKLRAKKRKSSIDQDAKRVQDKN